MKESPLFLFWIVIAPLFASGLTACALSMRSADESQATIIMVRGLDAEIRGVKERLLEVETEWDARWASLTTDEDNSQQVGTVMLCDGTSCRIIGIMTRKDFDALNPGDNASGIPVKKTFTPITDANPHAWHGCKCKTCRCKDCMCGLRKEGP